MLYLFDNEAFAASLSFLQAYKLGLYGPKYMWIIHGNIRNRLTTEEDYLECTAAEVIKASNLTITVGQLNYILKNETVITGEVCDIFLSCKARLTA